ncbi:pteridine reductase [Bathymodiolus platifrons methanotrophic gill symbiont]|uniref:pteridine reductase n=1 Tax=Bathymodiolus platifrons methanotrophic gill symbiont TaxID=113268 RepID=UPI000B40ADF3|nr:pteridine reductase [Bathymodiolus platifrons methanotrophic gill symbiont]MCK5869827.1 pteridine reductase [Methyloprofundus sp.]TXK98054.1 pteridine reductase [Methylococcaceae bacterium CS5]TXL08532.1 pteridine reductase [Methylococcaceae bacterium CS3]TXL09148.1 pteridine reductase [Methylococcaceae bacterium CS1]TXL11332.1 pteridine reductase [Methylococcaceae bacterium CS2]TXL14055.1 pteridine reductase [Methylococcaceae bacterium HT4]TXL20767.1 pteridine reductase [Methylococcaceae
MRAKKNILITGAAKRVGAHCVRYLHGQGCNIVLHYRSSSEAANELANELNELRPDSVRLYQADLHDIQELQALADIAKQAWGGVDVLINNASAFYATELAEVTEAQWDDLLGSNLKSPFFLIQALASTLQSRNGCVINIVDIHAEKGLPGFPVYSIAKAGLAALTKILAKELAPEIRVNAVAPGAILWPDHQLAEQQKQEIQNKVALQRIGSPDDIAKAIGYLIYDAQYMTGQIMTLDGGRTLFS